MRRTTDPRVCVVATCERSKPSNVELTCAGHWKLVPRALKKALWDAAKVRSPAKRERAVWAAAENILAHLETLKVVLPPEVKLERPEGLEKPDAAPRIIQP